MERLEKGTFSMLTLTWCEGLQWAYYNKNEEENEMSSFQVSPIGKIIVKDNGMFVELEPKYIPALQALDGFCHLCIIWWFSDFDNAEMRSVLETPQPYKKAPDVMGIFATRSPARPNPIALTTSQISHIDRNNGVIQIA